ncbi:MAG TPA: sulfite exporter TauE/SafE family protein [Rudaea sp.]|nr:sulfite exporter TauE/SafE family protein [Rudaea sp.]
MLLYALLFAVAVWAGIQNALAGGGTFITFPVLLMAGLDARAANITSTIALFPGQVTTALAGRSQVSGNAQISFRALFAISIVGGAVGAGLLLLTPSAFFERLVPFLVLVATGIFTWGSFFRRTGEDGLHLGRASLACAQFAIAVYGGYFGGGIGILMLAALTAAGWQFRHAGATKNALAGVMNAAAVLVFAFSPDVDWIKAGVLAAGSIIGGQIGAYLLMRINLNLLRAFVVLIGLVLTVGLFARAYG